MGQRPRNAVTGHRRLRIAVAIAAAALITVSAASLTLDLGRKRALHQIIVRSQGATTRRAERRAAAIGRNQRGTVGE